MLPIKNDKGGLIAEIKTELLFVPDNGNAQIAKEQVQKELDDLKIIAEKIKKGMF
jgi:hypothetical protein